MGVEIHSSAVVSNAADIGTNVTIGPLVLVDGPVKIGNSCTIKSGAQILGRTTIGDDCQIGRNAIIGEDPQFLGFDPATPSGIVIGDRNIIRELVTVHRSKDPDGNTVIGDGNYLMSGVHIGHDVVMGSDNVIASNCLLGGHIHLGDHANLGGGAVFHQFIRIGDHCMVQGNARISKDIPPYLIAHDFNKIAGPNLIGLKRSGAPTWEISELKKLYRHLFLNGDGFRDTLSNHRPTATGLARHLIDFYDQDSSRGVCMRAGT